MTSDPFSVRGIILKSTDFKEKDRLISVLTRNHGVISIRVRGVSGRASKMSFVSIPYSYCDFVITSSNGFYYLKEGSIISGNSGIMNSLESMAVAGHISSCLLESVMQSDNSRECYDLAVYSFYVLSEHPDRYLEVMCIFNWKLMWVLGLAADIRDSVIRAGADITISQRSADILDFIGKSRVSRIYSVRLEDRDVTELRKFTIRYLSVSFEKEIRDPVAMLNLPVIGKEGQILG